MAVCVRRVRTLPPGARVAVTFCAVFVWYSCLVVCIIVQYIMWPVVFSLERAGYFRS